MCILSWHSRMVSAGIHLCPKVDTGSDLSPQSLGKETPGVTEKRLFPDRH